MLILFTIHHSCWYCASYSLTFLFPNFSLAPLRIASTRHPFPRSSRNRTSHSLPLLSPVFRELLDSCGAHFVNFRASPPCPRHPPCPTTLASAFLAPPTAAALCYRCTCACCRCYVLILSTARTYRSHLPPPWSAVFAAVCCSHRTFLPPGAAFVAALCCRVRLALLLLSSSASCFRRRNLPPLHTAAAAALCIFRSLSELSQSTAAAHLCHRRFLLLRLRAFTASCSPKSCIALAAPFVSATRSSTFSACSNYTPRRAAVLCC